MARYTGPKDKLSRREGVSLFGPPSKSLQRRLRQPPGIHGQKRRRPPSEYGIQLREKQKVKRMYGMLEKQFRRFFAIAARRPGATGETLVTMLERRLDNVVYRLGYANTRPMARQLVNHGHVEVNGRRVNIPSFLVEPTQSIQLRPKAREIPAVQEGIESRAIVVPPWLTRDGPAARVVRLPERNEVPEEIREDLIVEFYSR